MPERPWTSSESWMTHFLDKSYILCRKSTHDKLNTKCNKINIFYI